MKELNLYCIQGCRSSGSTVYIFIFDYVSVEKTFETKFFNDKQALANHKQQLVMRLKTTRALTF